MLKKFPSEKISVKRQNVIFFISRAPIHHSCTFNSRFFYELKHQGISLKGCGGLSVFDSVSLLLKFMFLLNKEHGLSDFKTS